MDSIDPIKIAILKNIFDTNGKIGSYSLFKKMKMPMADFMKAVFDLDKSELIIFNEDWLSITKKGSDFLIKSRPKRKKTGIPHGMLRKFQLMPDEPYIPSISRLDRLLKK